MDDTNECLQQKQSSFEGYISAGVVLETFYCSVNKGPFSLKKWIKGFHNRLDVQNGA